MRRANRRLPCGGIFDAPAQKQKLARTDEQISAPDFWNQPEKSQKVMQDRKRWEESVSNDGRSRSMTDDLDTLFELAREGEDVQRDIERDIKPYAALLERLGMRREGHLRQSTWTKGEWTDDLVYALLHDEWQSR